MQTGDLAAQRSLQGRDGMSICCCIKCNLKKYEWNYPNQQGQLVTLDDIENNALATKLLGQKRKMISKICPSDTVIPVLNCEISILNDQMYKNNFAKYFQLRVDHRNNSRGVSE